MKVGIIGGGFTGLTAAYELLCKGHEVVLLEKDNTWGGLSSSFEVLPGVKIERFYHHLFTNDREAINLATRLGLSAKLKVLDGKTSHYYDGEIYPLDSPISVLMFSPLPLIDRLRFGLVTLYLKLVNGSGLEGTTAVAWLKKWYGRRSYEVVWKPLLVGKFADHYEDVSMIWFWARVKKRTQGLIYPEGGFQTIIDKLIEEILSMGGRIEGGVKIQRLGQTGSGLWEVGVTKGENYYQLGPFDKLTVTTSAKTFLELFPSLPGGYRNKLGAIDYINAQILIMVLNRRLSTNYWMNIGDKSFPFLVVGEQSNLLGLDYYGGNSIVYLGNYLGDGDRRLALSEEELLTLYEPYLRKINPEFKKSWVTKSIKFVGPYAQPIVDVNYSARIPPFEVPGFNNLYFATMAQVYPWDRGVNYAIKLAQDLIAKHF